MIGKRRDIDERNGLMPMKDFLNIIWMQPINPYQMLLFGYANICFASCLVV